MTPDGKFTASRAVNEGRIVANAEGLADTIRVILLPGRLTRITISPSSVKLKPRQVTAFRVTGFDAFNNRITIKPLWHTVGGIGTINKQTGVFTAGTRAGTGYVIAYTDSIFGDTGTSVTGSAKVVVEQMLPVAYTLAQNVPNPFNPETTIHYELPEMANVRLVIYDLSGQAIRTLVHDAHHQPGQYTVMWDGQDGAGRPVASGVYFYRLEAVDRGVVETKRMVLVR
jgi:hypothetical protein